MTAANHGLQEGCILAHRVRALELLLPGCARSKRGQRLGLYAGRNAVRTDLIWYLEKKHNQ